ncbi:hypothetical protein FQR65_LT15096 [Abscondita terminalis]|nr:hypothetical protein FQR65_LT15096 [Abscondita terminalis]
MDDLINILAIRNLEEAEGQHRPNKTHYPRDPFIELNERQFINMFRTSYTSSTSNNRFRHLIKAALNFFRSGSYQLNVASNNYIQMSQSSVSNCTKEVVSALVEPAILNEWVRFPENFNELNKVRQSFYDEHGFQGVVGCIDCTHVAIVPPGSDDPEHLRFKPDYYNRQYPGSTNDAYIWSRSDVQNVLKTLHTMGHTDYFY